MPFSFIYVFGYDVVEDIVPPERRGNARGTKLLFPLKSCVFLGKSLKAATSFLVGKLKERHASFNRTRRGLNREVIGENKTTPKRPSNYASNE
jgi:hypothetical protein